MAEVADDLTYEVFRSVQRDIRSMKDGLNDIGNEIVSTRPNVVSVHRDLHDVYDIPGRHEERPDRFARRPDPRSEQQRLFDLQT